MLFCKTKLKPLLAHSALVATLVLVSQGAWAQTLHAIIVADTNDTQIGASKDRDDINKLVSQIGENTCLQPSTTVIDGDSVAPGGGGYDKVKSAIENLSIAPNDVVLFYYSGHGANADKGSRWPGLGVEGQSTPRSRWIELAWVKETLISKHPRFFMAMADACNVLPGSGGSRGHRGAQRSGYEQLFLDYSGYIIASGSIPDQYSFGKEGVGGYFTQQFLKSLYKGLNSSSPDWAGIMAQATQIIQVKHDQKQQKPQADVQVTNSGARASRKNACALSAPGTPIPVPPIPSPIHEGTCADDVYYINGNGERCCKRQTGVEFCPKD